MKECLCYRGIIRRSTQAIANEQMNGHWIVGLLLLLVLVAGPFVLPAEAELTLPAVFSDGMVLQRGKHVPVWGRADAGSTVTVAFAGQTHETIADSASHWKVLLRPMEASSQSQTLRVRSSGSGEEVAIGSVLVGEVWLCSGQSNMAMAMKSAEGVEEEKKVANRPSLRMYLAGLNSSLEPQDDSPGVWVVCSPDTLERLAAVPYYFATEIQTQLDVPVGLLRVAWGGSHIETWIPEEALESFPSVMAYKASEDRKQLQSIDGAQPWKYYPGKLFNGMIHPVAPYGIRGVLWYQGEGNAHTIHDAMIYRDQLASLAASWRTLWGEELPIYSVQLPNYKAATTEENAWAYVRESILHFRNKVPGVGMAVAIDAGDPDNIHPRNKRPIGERLARQALVFTYGKSLVPGGPLYHSMAKQVNRIIVSFDDVGSGLASAEGNPLCWFEVAGDDRKFVPADAHIENNTVVVSSAEVSNPIAVRYAWANNPAGCNLINRDGFPASPFRTDTWDQVKP